MNKYSAKKYGQRSLLCLENLFGDVLEHCILNARVERGKDLAVMKEDYTKIYGQKSLLCLEIRVFEHCNFQCLCEQRCICFKSHIQKS